MAGLLMAPQQALAGGHMQNFVKPAPPGYISFQTRQKINAAHAERADEEWRQIRAAQPQTQAELQALKEKRIARTMTQLTEMANYPGNAEALELAKISY